MMQECSMRDKIKPGVYAILSAVFQDGFQL